MPPGIASHLTGKVFLLLFVHKKKSSPSTTQPKFFSKNSNFPLAPLSNVSYYACMSHPPPSLADQFGSLRKAAGGDSARGWLPASVHALITAFLTRIFGQLEQLFLLWQSGDLPIPASTRPQGGTASCDRAGISGQLTHPLGQSAQWIAVPPSLGTPTGHTQGRENRRRIRDTRVGLRLAKPVKPAPGRTPSRLTPPGTAQSGAPRCCARDPPAFRRPIRRKSCCASMLQHAHIIT